MKLLTKISIRYILYALIVMSISGIAIYFILSIIIDKQMDEQLASKLDQVEEQLSQNPQTDFFEPFTIIREIEKTIEKTDFSDTLIYIQTEKEFEECRRIEAVKYISGTCYNITICKSKIESEDLLQTLALVTFFAMLLLTATLILVNRKVAKSVWSPFYKNLTLIEQFSVNNNQPVLFEKTGIKEFEKLNAVIGHLTDQVISDYQNLKQFTEDASHEMQTPLAIIRSKLETLLNETGLTEKQINTLNGIYSSANQLARLNKSLILLAKLNNNQFEPSSEINFQELINEKINEWKELLELKQIELISTFQNNIQFNMSPILAEMLVSNLFSNAINHNIIKGQLITSIQENKLLISNSGKKELKNPQAIFNRFYKENSSSKSVGLGLAIVKKICDNYSISIQYTFENQKHSFVLTFPL